MGDAALIWETSSIFTKAKRKQGKEEQGHSHAKNIEQEHGQCISIVSQNNGGGSLNRVRWAITRMGCSHLSVGRHQWFSVGSGMFGFTLFSQYSLLSDSCSVGFDSFTVMFVNFGYGVQIKTRIKLAASEWAFQLVRIGNVSGGEGTKSGIQVSYMLGKQCELHPLPY